MSKTKSTIWKYYAFSFFRGLHFFSAVLIPFFTDWGHITMLQITFLQSWFMLWIFLLEVPTGAIADYFGRKYSMALGAIVITIGAIIYSSFPYFSIFLVAEILFATSFALISGADQAWLYDSLKEQGREDENTKIVGRAQSFELGGILVAAPIGSIIAANFGVQSPMFFSAISFFTAFLIALTFKEPKIKTSPSESKRYFQIAKDGFLYFYKHQVLRKIAFDAIIVASAGYFVIWFYQRLLQNSNVSVFYFGFIHAVLVLVQILISSNIVYLEKLFGGKKRMMRLTALLTAGSLLLVSLFPNIITIFILILLAGGFGLTRYNLMISYMQKFIPSEKRATVLSSISMGRRFCLVLLNPIIGFTADYSLNLALFIVGLLPLAIFLFSPIEKGGLED